MRLQASGEPHPNILHPGLVTTFLHIRKFVGTYSWVAEYSLDTGTTEAYTQFLIIVGRH
jgi:hypothetical protein